jgi:hypothetical protein
MRRQTLLDVLETLARLGSGKNAVICDVSGYSQITVAHCLGRLIDLKLVGRTPPTFFITERGRIAAAILAGKQHRKTWKAQRGSNPRPTHSKCVALPTELCANRELK